MVDVKEKCTECIHHATCKYCEFYEKYCKKITDYIHDLEDQSDQICNVKITCRHYTEIKPVVRSNFELR